MHIATCLVSPPAEDDGVETHEAFRPDLPQDWRVTGRGPTPLDAIRDFADKTDAMLARVEAEPPAVVHVQLRDAKALLAIGVEAVTAAQRSRFIDHLLMKFKTEAITFLQEHS